MSLTVMSIVLLAALLHASWNFLIKRADDKFLSMSAMVIGHVPLAVLALCFAPFPAPAAWPYLLGSALFHLGYQVFLLNAYRFGDLSQVYPLARGVAPLLVTLVSVLLLGVGLSSVELLAIALIISGVISFGYRRGAAAGDQLATWLALITGGFIAGYSLTDGLGARMAGTAFGYYGTLAILNALVWSVYARVSRPGLLTRLVCQEWRLTLIAGGASFSAYVLVVWAFTQAPIALVTALRETSMIFALLLGVLVLKEKLTYWKLMAAGLTLLGVIVLKTGTV